MVNDAHKRYTCLEVQPLLRRCRDCNSTLTNTETLCFTCGAAVPRELGSMLGRRFTKLITYSFFGSAVLTVASLFFDFTPSFIKCLASTLVLLLVKSSADQMFEKKKG